MSANRQKTLVLADQMGCRYAAGMTPEQVAASIPRLPGHNGKSNSVVLVNRAAPEGQQEMSVILTLRDDGILHLMISDQEDELLYDGPWEIDR